MFLEVLMLVCLLWYLYKKVDPPPRFGIYRRPGKWFPLKFIIFYLYLIIRKWRLKNQSDVDKPGYGMAAKNTIDAMECAQPLAKNQPKAVDAVFFSGSNRNGQYLVISTARRPKRLVDSFLYLRIPEVGLLQGPWLPDSSIKADEDMAFKAQGINLKPIVPMRQWNVSYNGQMRFANDKDKLVNVKFDLTWTTQLPYFDFNVDIPPVAMAKAIANEPWTREFFDNLKESHQNHYEQMGNLDGEVEIEDYGTFPLHLNSYRDHSFGKKREWSYIHRYILHNVTAEDGTRFMVGVMSLPMSFSVFELGYVYTPCGKLHGVEWCDLPIWSLGEDGNAPTNYGFSFGAGGKIYDVQVEVLETAELFISKDWEARILERTAKFTVNNLKAWGMTEWQYRNPEGRPEKFESKE